VRVCVCGASVWCVREWRGTSAAQQPNVGAFRASMRSREGSNKRGVWGERCEDGGGGGGWLLDRRSSSRYRGVLTFAPAKVKMRNLPAHVMDSRLEVMNRCIASNDAV
jgi:hypothetical protein